MIDVNTLTKTYQRRFHEDIEFRRKLYHILYENFFKKYIPSDAVVLEIGAGYCELINSINAKKKLALDLNPDCKKFAAEDVEVIINSSTDMRDIDSESIDVIIANNFFEHLTKDDIIETLKECYRVLKLDGRLLILQPNIRFCYKDYWMFFDHITPLDDRSLSEILEIIGFEIVECKPKFLPYTTKSKLPKLLIFAKIYLKFPVLWWIFGKQCFICAKKIIQ